MSSASVSVLKITEGKTGEQAGPPNDLAKAFRHAAHSMLIQPAAPLQTALYRKDEPLFPFSSSVIN
ncbi:hypothetical protein JOB18_007613 [Solea senegalensis]|uniref:Uncharacterized protein n=1 Tax=Solea senegalensis TaxID=28829 RepID=A0AAV6S8I6_SOLSE|nr:hypothetical protein JOB18_007613 [Solea senegalensis]